MPCLIEYKGTQYFNQLRVSSLIQIKEEKNLKLLHTLYVVYTPCFCLFDFILNVPSTIFQLNRDGSSWVEPVISKDKCVLLKEHNEETLMRLEPAVNSMLN